VNNKHVNSTRTSSNKNPAHSYDTTFLVIVVLLLLLIAFCYVVYRAIYRSAKRRVREDVYKSTVGTPMCAIQTG